MSPKRKRILLKHRRDPLSQVFSNLIQISTDNVNKRMKNKMQKVYRNYVILPETPRVEIPGHIQRETFDCDTNAECKPLVTSTLKL